METRHTTGLIPVAAAFGGNLLVMLVKAGAAIVAIILLSIG